MRIGIVGGGRAAYALARSVDASRLELGGVTLRAGSMSRIGEDLGIAILPLESLLERADVVALAVSDSALPEIAESLNERAPASTYLFHLSGAHSASLFSRARGFALHPLRAISRNESLTGSLFVFDGDGESESIARQLVEQFGGTFTAIDAQLKPLYHAAAVFASNYVAAMLESSEQLMRKAGVEVRPEHLASLARSAIANWEASSGAARFTGPLVRGDASVVARHVEALEGERELHHLYSAIGRELVRAIARHSPERADLEQLARALDRDPFP